MAKRKRLGKEERDTYKKYLAAGKKKKAERFKKNQLAKLGKKVQEKRLKQPTTKPTGKATAKPKPRPKAKSKAATKPTVREERVAKKAAELGVEIPKEFEGKSGKAAKFLKRFENKGAEAAQEYGISQGATFSPIQEDTFVEDTFGQDPIVEDDFLAEPEEIVDIPSLLNDALDARDIGAGDATVDALPEGLNIEDLLPFINNADVNLDDDPIFQRELERGLEDLQSYRAAHGLLKSGANIDDAEDFIADITERGIREKRGLLANDADRLLSVLNTGEGIKANEYSKSFNMADFLRGLGNDEAAISSRKIQDMISLFGISDGTTLGYDATGNVIDAKSKAIGSYIPEFGNYQSTPSATKVVPTGPSPDGDIIRAIRDGRIEEAEIIKENSPDGKHAMKGGDWIKAGVDIATKAIGGLF